MPELPEVETVRRTLNKLVSNRKIIDMVIFYDKIIQGDTDDFMEKIKGQTIKTIERKGKYLIFILDDYYMISHLRMEGKYYHLNGDYEINKHYHLIFKLDDSYDLIYHDTRKFGRIELISKDVDYHGYIKIACDANTAEFNESYLKSILKKQAIKPFLLDQKNVAGIGNIYVDEILFLSRVHPLRLANQLSDEEISDIVKYAKIVLDQAIIKGGTTIKSYTSSLGVNGLFQLELKVHNQAGKKCVNCGTIIEKTKVFGRGTYICKRCNVL